MDVEARLETTLAKVTAARAKKERKKALPSDLLKCAAILHPSVLICTGQSFAIKAIELTSEKEYSNDHVRPHSRAR
jgi:hypothetical protein